MFGFPTGAHFPEQWLWWCRVKHNKFHFGCRRYTGVNLLNDYIFPLGQYPASYNDRGHSHDKYGCHASLPLRVQIAFVMYYED